MAAATLVFIGGGLPHGAYDITLLRRAGAIDRNGTVLAIAAYAAVAGTMALLWMTVPLIALIVFLAVAAIHFGADWRMLDEPLLRLAAGAAVIAAPAIAHPAAVTSLFVAMSEDRAAVIAKIAMAAAPVALLVTAVGIWIAWQEGSRAWAAATTLCLVLLLMAPPVAGFALFFVFLHSPRHLAETRVALRDLSPSRWLAIGAALSGSAIMGWWAFHYFVPGRLGGDMTSQAFQLLASVAVPHLLFSHWLESRLREEPGAVSA